MENFHGVKLYSRSKQGIGQENSSDDTQVNSKKVIFGNYFSMNKVHF
jgi:hypothetical protein